MLSKSANAENENRRSWPRSERLRIVELTMQPGTSVQSVAQEHRIHSSTISYWKKLYRTGQLAEPSAKRESHKSHPQNFLPITIDANPTIAISDKIALQITLLNGLSLRIEGDSLNLQSLALFINTLRV